jgi:hydrogenase maturation factor HypF (carbamoyltransferase family)
MSKLKPISVRDIRVSDIIHQKSILGDYSVVEVTAEIIKEISENPNQQKYYPLPISFEILDKVMNFSCEEEDANKSVFGNAVFIIWCNKKYPDLWNGGVRKDHNRIGVISCVHTLQQQYKFFFKQELLFKKEFFK